MTTASRQRNPRGHGDQLRADLLAAAAGLVSETGDATALSLRSIAARAGVAATSVYLHFPDVDAVKMALAQQWFAEFAAIRDRAGSDRPDPGDALVARCRVYVTYALEHPGPYRLMFGPTLAALADPTGADPTGAGAATPSQSAFDALMASVERCAPDGDPRRLALLLWTALHGQVMLRLDRPAFPWPPVEATVQELVARLILRSR